MENGKLARVKEATKTLLKRFGPLILTGLAAVAEHHWLDHKDESADRREGRDRDEPADRNQIRKLEREVSDLKRSLSQKVRDEEEKERERNGRPPPRIREQILREWTPPLREERARDQDRGRGQTDDRSRRRSFQPHQQIFVEQVREADGRGRTLQYETPQPSAYPPYYQHPTTPPMQTPQYIPLPVSPQNRDYVRPTRRQPSLHRRHRRHRHRYSSVPTRTYNEAEAEAILAGKVAALAGAVEALHVGDIRGDWIGPKGLRVGTTMAATYGASRSRDRNPDDYRARDVVVDVGTGLLVNRLVHGSSRRLEEEEEQQRRRGRRWSYCY
jgi:hypothetical protein